MNLDRDLVRLVARARDGVCVTSYEQLRRQRAHLIGVNWGYVILDEGHKIRNPDAEVTLAAKQLATVTALSCVGVCCWNFCQFLGWLHVHGKICQ